MQILSILLFILVLVSGSFFAAYKFDKAFEKTFPITCLVFVLLSFILGLFNILVISTPVIIVVALGLYGYTIYQVIKNKDLKRVLNKIFTPGFVILVLFILVFIFGLKGKLFNTNDEFSHWGDIVKVMTTIEDFGTNPASQSIFKSYPPAVSIFQYILEKINYYLTGEVFVEWLCYIAYDIFCISIILPFTKNFSFKRLSSIITSIIVLFCLPYVFFLPSFISLHVETIMGFFIATLALQLVWNEDDLLSDIRYLLMLGVLVLVKDSGLLFSIFFGIGFALKKVLNKDGSKKDKLLNCLYTICAIAIPKILWSIDIKINHAAKSFSNKFDLVSLFNVLTGREDSYRREVLKNFFDQTMIEGTYVGSTGIFVTYILIIALLICSTIIVTSLIKNKFEEKSTSSKITRYTLIISLIVFVVGTCVTYMYKFSVDEAINLASYERYLSILFIGMSLFVAISFIMLIDTNDKLHEALDCVLVCVLLCLVSSEVVTSFFTRSTVKTSAAYRQEVCAEIIEKSKNILEPNDKVWFISVYSDGEDRLVYKYSLRPTLVDGDVTIKTKIDEDDNFAVEYSADEWMNELVSGNYDYVALYVVNDDFIEDYGSVFEDVDDIENETIFEVNKDTKTLSLCE